MLPIRSRITSDNYFKFRLTGYWYLKLLALKSQSCFEFPGVDKLC